MLGLPADCGYQRLAVAAGRGASTGPLGAPPSMSLIAARQSALLPYPSPDRYGAADAQSEPSATRTQRVAWSGATRCSGGTSATHRSLA